MNDFQDAAEAMAISDSWSASSAMLRPMSEKMKVPSWPNSQSGTMTIMNPDTSLVPGAVLRIWSAGRSVLAVEWHAPDTRPSASPIFTIMVPK